MITNPVIRILYTVVLVLVVFFVPWWAVLILALVGAMVFPWYLESVFIGLYFDVFFGYPALDWYRNIMHTAIFTLPVLAIQYIKPRINYGKF